MNKIDQEDLMYCELISIYKSLEKNENNIPPTMLYNEGWMLRLILHWFSGKKELEHEFQFSQNANWYSEALLPTIFKPKKRGDKLGESMTHSDGVIGNYSIGNSGIGDLELSNNCGQFVVIEAKMFSNFSKGTTNAKDFNQVARNIACMCYIISKSKIEFNKIERLAFYAIIPKVQIEKEKTFKDYVERKNIRKSIFDRLTSYKDSSGDDEDISKFEKLYEEFFKKIEIKLLSWESVIQFICENDSRFGKKIQKFYKKCLEMGELDKKRDSEKNPNHAV